MVERGVKAGGKIGRFHITKYTNFFHPLSRSYSASLVSTAFTLSEAEEPGDGVLLHGIGEVKEESGIRP